MNNNRISTQPLRDALAEYDASEADRRAAWKRVETKNDITGAVAADAVALRKVQHAYWEVTKAYNSRQDCSLISISDARRIAAMEYV